jgi:PAS domain S-box-containing protein
MRSHIDKFNASMIEERLQRLLHFEAAVIRTDSNFGLRRPARHTLQADLPVAGEIGGKWCDQSSLGDSQSAANRHISKLFFANQPLVRSVEHWRRDDIRGKLKSMARFPLITVEQPQLSAHIRYSVALGVVGATLAVRLALLPYLGRDVPFISFFLAVVVSSWFGGFGPGILATAVSALAGRYFILNVPGEEGPAWVIAMLFAGQGALIAYLLDSMKVSKRRIAGIVESISDGFAVFDSEWRIVYVNEPGAELARRPTTELVGRNLWTMFPEVVGTEFWAKMHEAMREQRPVHFEHLALDRQRWFEHTAYPSAGGLTLYTRDITDRKLARADLEAANTQIERMNLELEEHVQERTAQLNATIGELEAFSYTVSHDLRAPLRAIDGFSRLLFEDYHSKLDAEGQRLLEVIRNSTVKMGKLVDGLLAFSRLGRQVMGSSMIDMEELAREAFTEARGLENPDNVEVKFGKLPPAIGDRVLLRQVFINLFSNAMKFTRGRQPALIEAGSRSEDDQNIFYVKDNGAGFDMLYADKLFGVFQRLHAVTEFEGTGLGLAIVQRIVHRHGGRVWAEGKPGEGANFYFSLPKVLSHDNTADLRRPA